MGAQDLQRLARYVVRRRTSLGFKYREDFATATGLSTRTLGDVERARRQVSDASVAVVEERLGWKPGSFEAILEGGEPEIITTAEPEQGPDRSALDSLVGDDPGLQAVWTGLLAIGELTDEERIHVITLLKALREAGALSGKASRGAATQPASSTR
ncbi:hypothetical protein ACQP2T_13325 [Nonomuraea sp. CA-143628]|uniref:hypothetical protein n=1 Tax=Nonomuraea sp. CA-143628 TaxID=3239997 RepID=UPI003D8E3479